MASNGERTIRLVIRDTAGEIFECEVLANTPLSRLAGDFFEDRNWPLRDQQGRAQRAVVDLVDPENPNRTKRLRGEQTLDEAGLFDGATLSIFPESVAGVDEKIRNASLVRDHNDLKELAEWNKSISFTTNRDHSPTEYDVIFRLPGFAALEADKHTPVRTNEHRVLITLGAEYPINAPYVRWLTPIFHPNINQLNGAVCLGVLREQYLPGLGLARLVTMLAEMAQYRNYDETNPFNLEAAKWAHAPEHHHFIYEIGGSPSQESIELLKELEKRYPEFKGPRLEFKPLHRTSARA